MKIEIEMALAAARGTPLGATTEMSTESKSNSSVAGRQRGLAHTDQIGGLHRECGSS